MRNTTEETQATPCPKKLSKEEAVQAAVILFELNTKREELLDLLERAGIPCDDAHAALRETAIEQWYGFVHAAIVYALMNQAPNAIVAEYLRSTRILLQTIAGYSEDHLEQFIDTTFSGYVRLMAQDKQKESPVLFYKQVLGGNPVEELPVERVAFLSGMMAITMCAILDKLEKYTFDVE